MNNHSRKEICICIKISISFFANKISKWLKVRYTRLKIMFAKKSSNLSSNNKHFCTFVKLLLKSQMETVELNLKDDIRQIRPRFFLQTVTCLIKFFSTFLSRSLLE